MLVYQTDYLTIDGRRNDCNWKDRSSLFLTYTKQCNGKLRRFEQTIYLEYEDPEKAQWVTSTNVNGWDTRDYWCYDVIRFIRALGYEVVDEWAIIRHAMKQRYSDTPSGAWLEPLNVVN